MNPEKRITAADALQHPWITSLATIVIDETETQEAMLNLLNFHAESKMKVATMSFIVS